jgi:hypothetical protein
MHGSFVINPLIRALYEHFTSVAGHIPMIASRRRDKRAWGLLPYFS